MADAVPGILEGLRIAEARRQARFVNQLNQQKLAADNEQEKARLDQRIKEHQDTVKYQEATLKAAAAVHKLQGLEQLQKIGQGYQEGAPAPPGVDVMPSSTPGRDILRFPIESDKTQPPIIGDPALASMITRNAYTDQEVAQPDVYASEAAARQEVREEPKRKTQAALQAAELIRQLALAKEREQATAIENEKNRISREKIQNDANKVRVLTATISANRAASTSQVNARTDRSYNTSITELGKIEKPVTDSLARFGRLEDTINFASPATDPLIAPELLTVMAGGQNSGLRMSEAEIARIVGGRTNFESLKSVINKWSADPNKPFLLTPAQRQQTKALMQVVGSKLRAKQEILTQARLALIDADDPEKHRRILADAIEKSRAIDVPKKVKLKAPDGSIAEFSEDEAQYYIKKGAQVVQ